MLHLKLTTDLQRGMGMLGLHQLHFFAQNYPWVVKYILKEVDIPFAITGIHITTLMSTSTMKPKVLTPVKWISYGRLSQHLLETGHTMKNFNLLYARLFYAFAKHYQKSEAKNLMDFQPIWVKFTVDLDKILYTARWLENGDRSPFVHELESFNPDHED